jgi:peptide/nickel transport system substrate-binding protein
MMNRPAPPFHRFPSGELKHAEPPLQSLPLAPAPLCRLAAPRGALAKTGKDNVVLALTLEPPGLDPTANAASSIGESGALQRLRVAHQNQRRRQRLAPAGRELGGLARPEDLHTFRLRKGVKFQQRRTLQRPRAVKFSLDRAGGDKSTNKDKRSYAKPQHACGR